MCYDSTFCFHGLFWMSDEEKLNISHGVITAHTHTHITPQMISTLRKREKSLFTLCKRMALCVTKAQEGLRQERGLFNICSVSAIIDFFPSTFSPLQENDFFRVRFVF